MIALYKSTWYSTADSAGVQQSDFVKRAAESAHLNTEPYVQPSASVVWSAIASQSSSE